MHIAVDFLADMLQGFGVPLEAMRGCDNRVRLKEELGKCLLVIGLGVLRGLRGVVDSSGSCLLRGDRCSPSGS